jgi:uncharacterized SAM-binding protein YcdF (DUF218 family)
MRQGKISMRKLFWFLTLIVLAWAIASGWFLVIDQPEKADAILVLAGETDRRPARALELLHQQYAPRIILNVPAAAKVYKWNQTEIAQTYVKSLPESAAITICPIYGLSTKDEAKDSAACVAASRARRVLLVTSDYHTQRALSIFRSELPGYTFSIAAAFDPREFGVQWWRHREWAKVNFSEWTRLLWWESVDRWR